MPRWGRPLHLLTLSCRDVSCLMSEGHDRRLTAAEAFAVRLHTVYCSACRRLRRQLVVLRRAARELAADPAGPALPADARDRILGALRDQA